MIWAYCWISFCIGMAVMAFWRDRLERRKYGPVWEITTTQGKMLVCELRGRG